MPAVDDVLRAPRVELLEVLAYVALLLGGAAVTDAAGPRVGGEHLADDRLRDALVEELREREVHVLDVLSLVDGVDDLQRRARRHDADLVDDERARRVFDLLQEVVARLEQLVGRP
jgi:hypothetical protein